MHPVMVQIQDGRDHAFKDIVGQLATEFSLTEEELRKQLPSGRALLFYNRVAWAKTHLRMAGLVEGTARGILRITERGKKVLKDNKGRIDLAVLWKQPGYESARLRKKEGVDVAPTAAADNQTPEEQIEESYQAIRESLGSELLQRLKAGSPAFFERVVVELLVKMGYGGTRKDAGEAVGRSGDEGVDGTIKEDRLGLDTIYIQAKRWEGNVSRPEIQKFVGALQGFRAMKGIFITTSSFTKEAEDYAGKIDSKIVLIDGERLWNLMLDFGIGVTAVATYEIQRVDNDYFEEG